MYIYICIYIYMYIYIYTHCLSRLVLEGATRGCVAVCCGTLRCIAVCCSVLQCVAVCCSMCIRQWHRWSHVESSKGESMGDTAHVYVRHDSFICVYVWDMTHSYVSICDRFHAYVRHDSLICVAGLMHVSDVTHSHVFVEGSQKKGSSWTDSKLCVWHGAFVRETYDKASFIRVKRWKRGALKRDTYSLHETHLSLCSILPKWRSIGDLLVSACEEENTQFSHKILHKFHPQSVQFSTDTHCNTLQHSAAHWNTLQRTATHCNTTTHKCKPLLTAGNLLCM